LQPQPGYRYGRITMKARPLSDLPRLQALATEMENMCRNHVGKSNISSSSLLGKNDGRPSQCCSSQNGSTHAADTTTSTTNKDDCFWNIGVNPVLYRNGRDKMGYHADNDQGEELIMTVLVSSPANATRHVSIRPRHFQKHGWKDGDEDIELLLGAGDAYSMDGK
jgi:hypothetical protein